MAGPIKALPVCGICRGFTDDGLVVEFDCPSCGKTHTGSVSEDANPPIFVRPKCGCHVKMQYMVFDYKEDSKHENN